ncbi:DMT family transporter [Mucilaginibacter rubeus]|uniref:DMT family transporter n=1 Tax=Mucilaginibacter rubeus TaxID=2027860 RepID=A0AAE6JBA4_9SPHI|nr:MULTISPECIES: DMT family transporter [Mucilaginibacter]QEM02544.1 DMT family transporter [Mucilaginibacter rubeus]QEM15164.1 DMT family transporter [Mucilaginibacter gossypii]QTE42113.1 DMT family transporter [Mucilaginibacter rubeus]QTE48714.1 DMT family transporter [Mucilaginibacter rubeus]QTE53812.1 DMT family transporter [Mucilaginibacter rubeus]
MNNVSYIAATMMVGMCLPVMASSNGALGKTLGSPYLATLCAFLIAAIIVSLVITVTRTPLPGIAQVLSTNWVMWLGGVIIAMNILTFSIVPQKIGVGNTIIFFIAGQIISSVLIEHYGWLHYAAHPVNWARAGGIVLLVTGVILIKKF